MFNIAVGDEGYVNKYTESTPFFSMFNSPGAKKGFTEECSSRGNVKVMVEEITPFEDSPASHTEYLLIKSLTTGRKWLILSNAFSHRMESCST